MSVPVRAERAAAEGLPVHVETGLAAGIGLLSLMVNAGLAASNGEARRSIQGGAISVNDVKVSDAALQLGMADVTGEGHIKLSMGKKKHVLVKPA